MSHILELRRSCWICLLSTLPMGGLVCITTDPLPLVVDWTDDIWNLEGSYPDDRTGIPGQDVDLATLDPDIEGIFLNITVELSSLRVSGPTLHLIGAGDLVLGPGGLLLEGPVRVGGERMIDCSRGPLTIGPGGSYQADNPSDPKVRAALTAARVSVEEGPNDQPGTLDLSGSMTFTSLGDVQLNGAGAETDGDCTPPDFSTSGAADVTIAGDFEIIGSAGVEHQSSQDLNLQGDFDNRGTAPELFCWEGCLRFTRPDDAGSDSLHVLEAAGRDLGAVPAGLEDNFAMGSVMVDADQELHVVDSFDNDQLGQDMCEAHYVESLVLLPGSSLTIDNCRVYFRTLDDQRQDSSETTVTGPCGALLQINAAP